MTDVLEARRSAILARQGTLAELGAIHLLNPIPLPKSYGSVPAVPTPILVSLANIGLNNATKRELWALVRNRAEEERAQFASLVAKDATH